MRINHKNEQKIQRRVRTLTAALLVLSTLTLAFTVKTSVGAASSDVRRFDLGSKAQSGWTGVSASDAYNKNKGYGFGGTGVKNVSASGKNELSDAVQFTDWTTTFNVDVPKGLYRVKVTLGNTSRTSVYMENMIQIVNMTGNNAVDEILIPVTDGQLNVRAGAGKDGTAFSISALELERVSDDPTLPPTIWLCGDSTVCNYYPLNTSVQGGWGQMLSHYVDKGWNIRNMAASGQYAKGFAEGGQFTPIEYYGKPGDVYIISIGINDSKYYKGDEYQRVITDMTKRAKKKGMEVILVKQQGRNGDAQKNPLLSYRWYAKELDAVAKAEQVQIVDLFILWQDYCVKIGADKTTQLYMNGDTLHPNRAGAEKLAELFASQFKKSPGTAQQPTQAPTTEPLTEPPTQPATQPASALPEPDEPAEFIYGDVNFDGVVDIFDLGLLKRQLAGSILGRNALRRADVNADGAVSVTDAIALQKYLLTGKHVPAFAEKTGFYYAIDQTISKGVTETSNAGFRELGYINLDNETGSSITWTVFAPEDGNYLCTFGIANGSTSNRQMQIEVNYADARQQDFPTTGAWTAWQERSVVLPLKAGKNTIRMTSLTAEGGPNFDYLRTKPADAQSAEPSGEPRPITLSVSQHTNPFAGNITSKSDRYNYGGDPAAFVDGDTVYAYTGHDISTNAEVEKAVYNIPEYLCYSTKDLVNWNYEGVVMNMKDVSWGDAKSAWAGQVVKHNGKYYLYFCSWDKTSEGRQSIGVAVADSPTGPFRDIGHPVVKGTLTSDQTSFWDDIDPTAWIEKDQNGTEHRYLAWGNSRYYICELNDDMISVKDLNGDGKITFAGEGTNGDVFYRGKGLTMYTEAPWLYRRQHEDGSYYGNYYLIYAHGWREQMAYSTCTDLLKGDWTFGGVIFDCNATSNTNHSGLFDFKGKTYMIYHNGALPEGNGYRRSPNICEVRFDNSGKILKMEETTAGIGGTVSQIINQNGALLGDSAFTNSTVDKDYPYTNVALGFGMANLTAHDTDWVLVPGLANVEEPTYVSIESENKTGLFVTVNADGTGAVLAQPTTLLENDLKRATFRTIEGLADRNKVSFESVSHPGMYLTCTASGAVTLTNGSDAGACTFQLLRNK